MNPSKFPAFTIAAALIALGCCDTLFGQFQLTPQTSLASPLTFNGVPSGTESAAQNITVVYTGNGTTTITLNNGSAPWIVFPDGAVYNVNSTGVVGQPAGIPIKVNAATASTQTPGNYTGSFTLSNGQASATVYVAMMVTGASVLSANPTTLSFTATQGSNFASPNSSAVQINSSGPVLNYGVTGQTQVGNWLQFSPLTGTTGGAGLSVSVNPSGLSAGTYTGNVLVQSTTTSDSVNIPVTLTVSPSAVLSVTPSTPPPFLWQVGTSNPSALQLSVTSSNGNIGFNAAASPQVTWLVVTPQSGTTPGAVFVTPNPSGAGLVAGTYNTNVVITSGNMQVSVPIQLIAATHPLLQLSTGSLSFTGQFGSTTPPASQTVQVTAVGNGSTSQPFAFSSNQPWLTATTSGVFSGNGIGTTPSTLSVEVNPTGLAVGTYTGTLLITPSNSDNYSEAITVTFGVTATAALEAGPQSLLFSYETGLTPPAAQQVFVTSTGQPLTFTISPSVTAASNCPTTWLTATASSLTASASAPALLTVSVSTTGMTAGLCSGSIALNYTAPGGSTAAVNIGVTVAISAATQPELVVSLPVTATSGFGLETAPLGGGPYARIVTLTSTDNTTPVTWTASVNVPWLAIPGSQSGVTPFNLEVEVFPSAEINPGTYNGTFTISSTSIPNFELQVPVALTITPNVTVTAAPTSLTFSEAQGGPAPPAQTVTLASTGGSASFVASIQYLNGSGWLQVSPGSGTASGPIQVNIQPNTLSQGTYNATVTLNLLGAATPSITIPVTLTVGPAQTISATPNSLNFAYQIGSAAPAGQTIAVSSTGGAVAFTVGSSVTGSATGWLSTNITSGTTPQNVTVTVTTTGLAAGTYTGSVTISAPTVSSTPTTIPVTLVVSAAAAPSATVVENAASLIAGPVSAGGIVSIFGSNLGPSTPASFTLNSSGGVNSILSGVQVTFNNNPGTPIYVSATQINVIVPWEINGQQSASMVITYNGVESNPVTLTVQSQSPGLFTTNMQGSGQGAVLNQNGTANGSSTPAAENSVIALFGTGGGQTSPPGVTGSVTPVPTSASGLLKIPGTVTATIGGQPATVEFAGAAPGLVTGVLQVNVQIPSGIGTGTWPVTLSINGVPMSNTSATIAVQ
ncbi:MAG TPA: hypothetical protein VIY49_10545 [Bryobacteraceae bacterium]